MKPSVGTAARLGVGDAFGSTFSLIGRNLGTLGSLVLVLVVPYAILQASSEVSWTLFFITLVPQILLGTWACGALIRVAQRDIEGTVPVGTAWEAFTSVVPLTLPLVALQIVIGLVAAAGLILLVVPGLIVLTMWSVAIQAMVINGQKVGWSLERSSTLTKGSRLRIFLIGLLPFVLFFFVTVAGLILTDSQTVNAVISAASTVIVYPFCTVLFTVVYYRLLARETPHLQPASPSPPVVPAAG